MPPCSNPSPDTAPTAIYTLSLHDALPIYAHPSPSASRSSGKPTSARLVTITRIASSSPTSHAKRKQSSLRSEEHTSELQSRQYLVCRLLLEKKKHQNHDQNSLSRPCRHAP